MDQQSAHRRRLWLLIGVVAGLHLAVLLALWDQPIGARTAFRETQTALSIYWLAKDGPFWLYETPIFGYPWMVPFEFPLYQWIAAQFSLLTGLTIEQAGRVTSLACFAASLGLGGAILARALPGTGAYAIGLIFAVVSGAMVVPLYWASQVSIETMTVLLALGWLFFVVEAMRRARPAFFIGALVIGSLGALMKPFTMVPYFLLGGAFFIACHHRELWPVLQQGSLRRRVLPLTGFLVASLGPVVAALIWTEHANDIRAANPLSSWLSAYDDRMSQWFFGTLDQRLTFEFWRRILLRTAPTLLALGLALTLLARTGNLRERHGLRIVSLLCAAYLAPIMVFSNVYYTHDYYHLANQMLLAAAVAVVLAAQPERFRARTPRLLAVLVAVNLSAFVYAYLPIMDAQNQANVQRYTKIGAGIRTVTGPEATVAVLDDSWSSELAYGSQRRVITILPNLEAAGNPRQLHWLEALHLLETNPVYLAGERPVAAVTVCERFVEAIRAREPKRLAALSAFTARYGQSKRIADCTIYWSPNAG